MSGLQLPSNFQDFFADQLLEDDNYPAWGASSLSAGDQMLQQGWWQKSWSIRVGDETDGETTNPSFNGEHLLS